MYFQLLRVTSSSIVCAPLCFPKASNHRVDETLSVYSFYSICTACKFVTQKDCQKKSFWQLSLVQTRVSFYRLEEETEASPSQALSLVKAVPTDYLFRKGDPLEFIDGPISPTRLVGTHDWSIGYSQGELPVQMLFASSNKTAEQQCASLESAGHTHTIYADVTALVHNFVQANPARFRVKFGISVHTLCYLKAKTIE